MPKKSPRIFSREFKLEAVRRILAGEHVSALAARAEGSAQGSVRLAQALSGGRAGGAAAAGSTAQGRGVVAPRVRARAAMSRLATPGAPERIAELERKIGQQQVELDFFRQALRQVREARRPSAGPGATAVYAVIQAMTTPCRKASSRSSGCARWPASAGPATTAHWEASAPRAEETGVRDAIQRLALANRHYGYRRIARAAAPRGLGGEPQARAAPDAPGQSAVPAAAAVRAGHDRLAPWLAGGAEPGARPGADRPRPALGGRHHLHPAAGGVRLSGHRARCLQPPRGRLGVGRRICEASLAIAALTMALAARQPAPGSLIHHSDRGVQYACGDYTELLAAHDIQPSMSRVGNPYDNAKAESFMKTLKQEEVDGRAYRDVDACAQCRSAPSSRRSTIANGCTRRWPTGRQPSSRQTYRRCGAAAQQPRTRP